MPVRHTTQGGRMTRKGAAGRPKGKGKANPKNMKKTTKLQAYGHYYI